MSILRELGITIGSNNKVERVFNGLFPNFLEINYAKPSEYVHTYYEKYKETQQNISDSNSNNNINGKIFEYILATLFVRENILPFYMNAKVAFVPNVNFDLMFYTASNGPICISAKTSLRERYKQADLEAIALKYVHRKSLSFLVTLDTHEASNVRRKIQTGDVIGLDDVVVATDDMFNELIIRLRALEFSTPPTVKVIDSNQIITSEKVLRVIAST